MVCNYNTPNGPDLQLVWQDMPQKKSAENPFGQLVLSAKPNVRSLRPVLTIGDGPGSFDLDAESLARLDRFQHRTALTFATTQVCGIFQHKVTQIAVEVGPYKLAGIEQRLISVEPILNAYYPHHHSNT